MTDLLPFQPEAEYKRREIHLALGGQWQGGISTPQRSKLIFIFSGENADLYGYKDNWRDDGVFLYTGEGQVGDMEFTKGNRAIRDHVADGKELHLFRQLKNGIVRYVEQLVYQGYHYRDGRDRNGHSRRTIVFELRPLPHRQ